MILGLNINKLMQTAKKLT